MIKMCLRAGTLSLVAGGLMLLTGCVVTPDGRVGFMPVVVSPPVVVTSPAYVAPEPVYVAPQPEVVVSVPDDYTWDGYEYVGFVGGSYVYLGPGNVWIGCEPFRLERFHGWERGHPDWRAHAIRNDRFRNDRNGHFQPRRDDRHDAHPDNRAKPAQKKHDDGHDGH